MFSKYLYIQFWGIAVAALASVFGIVITAIPLLQNRAQAADWFGLIAAIAASVGSFVALWANKRLP